MNYKVDTAPIYQSTKTGLQRVFDYITTQKNTTSLTVNDFTNLTGISPYDMPFVQLLQKMAQDSQSTSNKSINKNDFDEMVRNIGQQGLTQEQFNIIYSQGSDSQKEMIEKVISNFRKIDENSDGKVSQGEISKYFINKEIEDKRNEFNKVKTSNYTSFYNETSSTNSTNNDSDEVSSTDLTE